MSTQPQSRLATLLSPANLLASRKLVQGGFALFSLYAGYRFYLFYLWAIGTANEYTPRPPAVEGFLPIGALVSLKQLLLTGRYETIHPAALTIFLAALTIGFLFRKGFCGWICPVGFFSNLAESIGRKLKILIPVPYWLDYPLLSLKYWLLLLFVVLILIKMDLNSIESFNRGPYNVAVDAKMLLFFLHPSPLALKCMAFLVLISFLVRNFWCRYLCPYGALLGILGSVSPCQVQRQEELCISCHKCDRTCPAAITVSRKRTVRTAECIGCLQCLSVCPVPECLTVRVPGEKKVNPYLLPAAIVGVFLLFWLVATLTGHWQSQLPLEVIKKYYRIGLEIPHP